MPGMFDDLIPQQAAPAQGAAPGGMFDDLIPAQQAQQAREAAAARTAGPRRGHFDAGNTTWNDVGAAVTQGAKGFNEGIAPVVDLAMLPANLGTMAVNAVKGGEPFQTPSQTYHRAFVDGVPPTTHGQQAIRAGGEMAGANLPLLAGGAGLAGSSMRAGVPLIEQAAGGIVGKVRGAADAVLDWMRANPVVAARTDTSGAFLSGAGGETARGMAEEAGASPTKQKFAEMAGQFGTPAAAFGWGKYGITPLALKTGAAVGKRALQAVPEEAVPGFMKPEGGSVAERLAERLAFSNREGKYGEPGAPPMERTPPPAHMTASAESAPDTPARQAGPKPLDELLAPQAFTNTQPPPKAPNFATRQMDRGAIERQQRATGAVQKDIAAATSTPEGSANVAEAARIKEQVPGFQPGIAKETGDPALLNLQRDIESRATGPELRAAQGRSAQNEGAIRTFADEAVPAAGANPEDAAARAGQRRVDTVSGRLEQQAEGLRRQVAERSNIPATDRTAAGEQLRAERNTLEQQSGNRVNELRRNIAEPNTVVEVHPARPATVRESVGPTGATRNPQAILQRVETLSNIAAGRRVAPAVQQTMENLGYVKNGELTPSGRSHLTELQALIIPGEPAVTMTVNQILTRRAALNQEGRDLSHATNRSVADIRRMRQINDERQHLDGIIEDINLPGMTEYREYYRDEHVPRFREGASKDVGRFDQNAIGKNYVSSEDVPREFFQPNNISEARQFNRTYGESPGARQTMTDYALDSLRTDTTVMDPVTHQLRPGGIERWLTKNQRILDEMPWIRDAVNARNPDALYARLRQVEQRQRTVQGSTLAKTLGKEPGEAVDAALKDWRVARTMKNSVRSDAGGDAALTRAVWERLPDPMNAAAVEKFVADNKRSLDILLTPKHMADIDTIVKAARMETQIPAPKGTVESPSSVADKVGKFAGISIPSFLSRFRAQAQGRTGGVYTAADIGLQMFSKFSTREVEAAWKEALYNPKVAQDLASVVSGKGTKPIISRLHNYLLTVGARDAIGEEEPAKGPASPPAGGTGKRSSLDEGRIVSDADERPAAGQQYADAKSQIEALRRHLGVNPTSTGNPETDRILKIIDDALKLKPVDKRSSLGAPTTSST